MRTALAILAAAVVLQDPKPATVEQRVAELEKRVAALEKAAAAPAKAPALTKKEWQARNYFAFEVFQLANAVKETPTRHNLADQTQRATARGRLMIHLMTLEDLKAPEDCAELWKLRKQSVQAQIDALGHKFDSPDAKRCFDEATRLLQESSDLEAKLR